MTNVSDNTIAIGYIRVSTDEQAREGTSLQVQQEQIEAYVRSREWTFYKLFKDEESGANFNRPGLMALMEAARSRLFQAVVVQDWDRLGRDQAHQLVIRAELKKLGVRIISLRQGEDRPGPEGDLMAGIYTAFAQYERAKIRQRLLSGMARRQREGSRGWALMPYGIRWDKERHRYFLDEKEAKIYRRIFELYRETGSYRRLADQLEREGLNDRRGKRFTRRHLSDLIRSEAAIGKWQVRDYEDPSRWVTLDIPPVVDRETWEAINEYRTKKAPQARSERSQHLLTGLVFCGKCGARMGVRTQSDRRGNISRLVYGCYRRAYRRNPDYKAYFGTNCDMPFIEKADLEESVWNRIEELLCQPEHLFDAIRTAERERDEHDEQAEITALDREIKKIKVKEGRYLDLAVESKVSRDVYQPRIKDLATRREHLEKQLQAAERRQAERNTAVIKLQDLTSFAGTMKDKIGNLTPAEKRDTIRLFFAGDKTSRIIAHPNDIAELAIDVDLDTLLGRRSNHAALCY